MALLKRYGFVVGLLFFSSVAITGSGGAWTPYNGGGTVYSYAEGTQAGIDIVETLYCFDPESAFLDSLLPAHWVSNWWEFDVFIGCTNTAQTWRYWWWAYDPCGNGDANADCMNPAACDSSITGLEFMRPVFSAGQHGDICHESSQCKMTAVNTLLLNGNQEGLIEFVGTDQECSGAPDVPITAGNEATQCISSGGDTYCATPDLADQNCGYFNDEYMCLDAVPAGNCTFFGDGNMVCATDSTAPPAPDDGTPGQVATPDSTLDANGTTGNIYNPTTIGGSSGGTSGGGQGDGPEGEGELTVEIDFTDIVESEPDSGTFDDDIETAITDLGTGLDAVVDELSDPDDFGQTTDVGSTLEGAFGVSLGCSDIHVNAFGNDVVFACSDAEIIRDVVGWIMRVLFLIAMFNLVTTKPTS